MKRGQRVVDLGCWPGGWMQVAANAVGPLGRVVGVDVARLEPPFTNENVIALEADLFDASTPERIRSQLGGLGDVVLCDAAPKLTGIRERDRAAEEELLISIEQMIPQLLQPNGALLVKLLECPEAAEFQQRLRRQFRRIQAVKTAASRKGSSERYLLARGFRAPGETEPGG